MQKKLIPTHKNKLERALKVYQVFELFSVWFVGCIVRSCCWSCKRIYTKLLTDPNVGLNRH